MTREGLSVASFIPDVELPSAPDGVPVRLRESGGKLTIFVTVHSARCAGCVEYLHALAGIQSELEIWEARFLVIVPGSLTEAQRLRSPVGTVLSDEHGLLAEDRSANVIVADRFGQVFDVARSSGAGHDLRGLRELEEWLKYLGTLCPD